MLINCSLKGNRPLRQSEAAAGSAWFTSGSFGGQGLPNRVGMMEIWYSSIKSASTSWRTTSDPPQIHILLPDVLWSWAVREGAPLEKGYVRAGGQVRAVGQDMGVKSLVDPLIRGELSGHLVMGPVSHDDGINLFQKTGISRITREIGSVTRQPIHTALGIGQTAVQTHCDVEDHLAAHGCGFFSVLGIPGPPHASSGVGARADGGTCP